MKRKHSDQEKGEALAVLAANGGNVKRTAKELGIPRTTLMEWASGRGVNDSVSEIRHETVTPLAQRLESLVHQILDILPEKLSDASPKELAVTLAIAVDKMQLLEGKPTERTEHEHRLTDEDRATGIAALLDRARARRTGQPAHLDD